MGYARIRSAGRIAVAFPTLTAALLPAAAAAQSGGGGLAPPEPPEAATVSCVEKCLSLSEVAEGGLIEVSGKNLGLVKTIRFADGTEAVAKPQSDRSVTATVPEDAKSGRVAVIDEAGGRSLSENEIQIAAAASVQDASGFRLREASAATDVAFFLGTRPAQVEYLFEAQGPTDIRIDVIRSGSEETVASIIQKAREPFATSTAIWNGRRADGRIARAGEYRFRVSALNGGGRSGGAAFVFSDHRFPLPGRHSYGDGLGAGRDHNGQDIFAKCGKPVYAARAGTIQANAFHGSAGYYLVIDGRKTGNDYAYMHLERGGRPAEGTRVKTGELIGYNSDTGNASGCHLHFELWSAPGWYEGGEVLDPTPLLKRWDRYS